MALPALLTTLTTLLPSVLGTVDKVVGDRDLAEKIKAELQTQVLTNQMQIMESASSIIKAEAQGESWLQRNWRPILMLTIVTIVANNFLVAPYLGAMFGVGLTLPMPEQLWDLMTLGVGGYIAGRSVEKVVDRIKAPSVPWRNPDTGQIHNIQ